MLMIEGSICGLSPENAKVAEIGKSEIRKWDLVSDTLPDIGSDWWESVRWTKPDVMGMIGRVGPLNVPRLCE